MAGDIQLSNGGIDLIVTTDYGPRISHFSMKGEPNLLVELPELKITGTPGDDFSLRGDIASGSLPKSL